MLVVVNVYYISQMKLDERDNKYLATATSNAKEKKGEIKGLVKRSSNCAIFLFGS